jgi:hypothetical protein
MVERDWGSWTDGGATKGIPHSGLAAGSRFSRRMGIVR